MYNNQQITNENIKEKIYNKKSTYVKSGALINNKFEEKIEVRI